MGGQLAYGFANERAPTQLKGQFISIPAKEENREIIRKYGLVLQDQLFYRTPTWEGLTWKKIDATGLMKMDHPVPLLCEWMSYIRDDVKLVDLVVPGSHDAGSYASDNYTPVAGSIINGYNQCQQWPVIGQLMFGSRYFDIRPTIAGKVAGMHVGKEDGCIWTHHSGFKGEKLSHILNGVKMFLKQYPTETVLFYLSHYENCNEDEATAEMTQYFPDLIIADNSLLMGQSRGKLIVIPELYMNENIPPKAANGKEGGHDGFYTWEPLCRHLTTVSRSLDEKFERFAACCTPNASVEKIPKFPRTQALIHSSPGLRDWLKLEESDHVGIVEHDWFGSPSEIANLIWLVIHKNWKRNHLTFPICCTNGRHDPVPDLTNAINKTNSYQRDDNDVCEVLFDPAPTKRVCANF